MKFRALSTLWVDDKLIEVGEDFTPNPVKNHKPCGAWEPIDDEAKAAFTAAGSPVAYNGNVEVSLPSAPESWVAAALAAGWQPVVPGMYPVPQYAAAPPAPVAPAVPVAPAAPPVAVPAAAPVAEKPAAAAAVIDEGAI